MPTLNLARRATDGSFDERVRRVSKAAKARLIANGVWDIEEEAEREVRQRTADELAKKAA